MLETARALRSQAAAEERVVVLLLPEALGGPTDATGLRATLSTSTAAIRALVCLAEHPAQALVTMLDDLNIDVEILLGPQVEAPATSAFMLRAPPGTSPEDQVEFAVALSDIVVVASPSEHSPLIRHVTELKKPIIMPGDRLPRVAPFINATHRLDPDARGWHAHGRRWSGRFEQAVMECLSFAWLGWNRVGLAESRKQLWKSVGRAWRPNAYFAPEGWQELAPDRAALDALSNIVAGFDAMDRSALYGSYVHRDITWVTHLGAAFAVLAAVAGHLSHNHEAWAGVEFVALVLVASLVFGARRTSLQDRWTACRFGAEQLRIARMSLPLLVLPPALATADALPVGGGHSSEEVAWEYSALAEVKRAVRDQGLPRLERGLTPGRAAAWLHLIVADQIDYHRRNHRKLERAERSLRFATQGIFIIAIVAVSAHFLFEAGWLLLFTAAGPAFAAALHGAGTRLGIVHRAALSLDVEQQLTRIDASLVEPIGAAAHSEDAWPKVRRLAYEACKIMGSENTSWHGLVRRYRDELP